MGNTISAPSFAPLFKPGRHQTFRPEVAWGVAADCQENIRSAIARAKVGDAFPFESIHLAHCLVKYIVPEDVGFSTSGDVTIVDRAYVRKIVAHPDEDKPAWRGWFARSPASDHVVSGESLRHPAAPIRIWATKEEAAASLSGSPRSSADVVDAPSTRAQV